MSLDKKTISQELPLAQKRTELQQVGCYVRIDQRTYENSYLTGASFVLLDPKTAKALGEMLDRMKEKGLLGEPEIKEQAKEEEKTMSTNTTQEASITVRENVETAFSFQGKTLVIEKTYMNVDEKVNKNCITLTVGQAETAALCEFLIRKLGYKSFRDAILPLKQWQEEIHGLSRSKGWYEKGQTRTLVESIALMHSELSEAIESIRKKEPPYWESLNQGIGAVKKPEGWATELADCVIRILDCCESEGVDIEAIMKLKHDFNKTRPHRHGGKTI